MHDSTQVDQSICPEWMQVQIVVSLTSENINMLHRIIYIYIYIVNLRVRHLQPKPYHHQS